MSTPTPSATSPSVFPYCWSAPCVHHTIVYRIPASSRPDDSCSDPLLKYIPCDGGCSSKTPAFTRSLVMQQFLCYSAVQGGVSSTKTERAANSSSYTHPPVEKTGIQALRMGKELKKIKTWLCCRKTGQATRDIAATVLFSPTCPLWVVERGTDWQERLCTSHPVDVQD